MAGLFIDKSTAPTFQDGMTLLEVLVSVTLTSLLMIALWSWFSGYLRTGSQARDYVAAMRDGLACERLLQEDIALAIVQVNGSVRIENPHQLRIYTASVIPGEPRHFREVVWLWQEKKGLQRIERGVAHWLSDNVTVQFSLVPDSVILRCQWSLLDAQGKKLGEEWTTCLTP
jgi:prepilin-type N-terminal cleavage/methylation domain-containing protein